MNTFPQAISGSKTNYKLLDPTGLSCTQTTFDTQGRTDVVTPPDDTRAKTIFYDRLHRLTDAIAVGASTAVIRCDDLGTTTNRTPNPGLGDVSAYGGVMGTNRINTPAHQKIQTQNELFKIFLKND